MADAAHIADVSVEDTWAKLKSDAGCILIDVRTRAEWSYVGVPDLSSLGKKPLLLEWQSFPDGKVDPQFVDRAREALAAVGADGKSALYFICRSGARSLSAARAMAAAGFGGCKNVTDGFEGPLDSERHRGRLGGWKAKGLPWTQG